MSEFVPRRKKFVADLFPYAQLDPSVPKSGVF
jgi:hypothetical protein